MMQLDVFVDFAVNHLEELSEGEAPWTRAITFRLRVA
jgi:hypothetical protein